MYIFGNINDIIRWNILSLWKSLRTGEEFQFDYTPQWYT